MNDYIDNKEYYESLDKRTRKYKDYKEWLDNRGKGLGDVVEDITRVTGIKSAVEHLFGDDCKCQERKEKLNNFGQKLRNVFRTPKIDFLNKQEYDWITEYFARTSNRGVMVKEDQIKLLEIHNRVFKTKKQISSCSSCLVDLRNKMLKLHNEYK